MIDIKVLRAMAASGATVEIIIAAVEAQQSADIERAAEIREKTRVRVKNHRERNRYSQDVTVTPPNVRVTGVTSDFDSKINDDVTVTPGKPPLSILSSLSSSEDLKEERKIEEERSSGLDPPLKKSSGKERGTRIDPRWKPNVMEFDYALGHGLSPGEIDLQAERFVNYWLAKTGDKALKLDWSATWRNWVTSPFNMRGNGNGNGHNGHGRSNNQLEDDGTDERRPGENLGHLARRLARAARKAEDRAANNPGQDASFGSD